jgi:hypothetical protein
MDRASIQMLRVTSGQGNSSMAVDLVSPVCYDIISAHRPILAQGIVFLSVKHSQCGWAGNM